MLARGLNEKGELRHRKQLPPLRQEEEREEAGTIRSWTHGGRDPLPSFQGLVRLVLGCRKLGPETDGGQRAVAGT